MPPLSLLSMTQNPPNLFFADVHFNRLVTEPGQMAHHTGKLKIVGQLNGVRIRITALLIIFLFHRLLECLI